MNLCRGKSEQALQVTDESVDVPLAGGLEDNVLVVVVPEAPRQLFIVHLWFVLADAPPPGNLIRVHHLELPSVPRPADEALAGLVRQQLQQELPQLDGTRAREAGAATRT